MKIDIAAVAPRIGSSYPSPWREMSARREKRALGDAAGLTQFGVNLTTLPPGEWSSQHHAHAAEDEFVHVLSGELVLVDDAGETMLVAGDSAGFKAGTGRAHHLENRSAAPAVYLEIGTRAPGGDSVSYPGIDLRLDAGDPAWRRTDGTAY